jgi:kelch-like protein 2/3
MLALEMAQRSSSNHLLFLSDSLSCLQSMRNRDMSRPVIAEILCCTHKMLLAGAVLVFMWVPSHVGLAGNSAADTAAKAALLMPISKLTLPYSDYLPLIRTHVLKQWQSSWSLETENKLHAIEPTVTIVKSYRLPRRDEIIIHRLRIGHTFLTHGHLLKRDSPPQCSVCQTQLTVEHILVHCPTWNAIRANHFTVTNLFDLFSTVTSRRIVDFIKEIGFYRRI